MFISIDPKNKQASSAPPEDTLMLLSSKKWFACRSTLLMGLGTGPFPLHNDPSPDMSLIIRDWTCAETTLRIRQDQVCLPLLALWFHCWACPSCWRNLHRHEPQKEICWKEMRELILNQHVFILAAIDPKSWGHAGHSAAARNQTVSTTVAPSKKCDSYLVKNARPGLITLAFWLNCNAKNKCVSPRTSQFQRLRNQKKPAGCSTEQWLQFHCEAVNCKHFLLATFWSMA